MATMKTSDVITAATEARQRLAELEHKLQSEIDAIDFGAFREERELTPDERTRRKETRATLAEVREAFTILAYVTLQRLDNSDELRQLRKNIDSINVGLDDDLDHLKTVEKYAGTAAKVADALARVAEKLAPLLV